MSAYKTLCLHLLLMILNSVIVPLRSAYPSSNPVILFSTTKDIRIVNVTKINNQKIKSTVLVKNYTYISGIDFHYEKQKICWSDHDIQSIWCCHYNGMVAENKVEIMASLSTPDGLAIDWYTDNIYWTDNESNRIEVATIDGKYRKVLFWTDIDQPRAIAVVPMRGFLFWTDWGEMPKIERAGMNGDPKTRKVIVSENIYWPNGLTVDYESERVYWIDGKLQFIKVMNFDGNDISKYLSSGFDYPYAVTQYHNKLFWTDWRTMAIHYYDKNVSQKPMELLAINNPMDIKVFNEERQPKHPHACQDNNGGCSHLCLLSQEEPFYTCACPIGIKLIDNKTCAQGPQEILILARRTDIYVIHLDSPDYSYKVIPLNDVRHSIAVDFDPIDGYIYWSDDEVKKIQKAKLNGSNQQDVITTDVQHPDGIAVDWVSRNVYWTDAGTDRIEVARLHGGYRKVIIGDGLIDPRGIAVAPELGWLFWSDWSGKDTKIERSNLDGSERTFIVHDNLGWPNGITLDLQRMKIYWCDAKSDKIEYADMDGSFRRELISDNLPHPFGFSLMGDYLYWTDWQRRSIDRAHKETGDGRQIIAEQMENVMGIKAVKLGEFTGWNPCQENNGNCSQLCLPRHNKTRICACQIEYELSRDKLGCIKPSAFLLYSKKNDIGKISIENEPLENSLFIPGIKQASSIDFDTNSLRVYWSDSQLKTIMRAFINGSEPQKVIDLGLASPESIAVDWLGLNIYWTDPVSHRIEVARLVGTSRRTLLWDETYEPHDIVLDPVYGYMYWSEWGQSNAIKKAALNGNNPKKLISTNGHATGLALDYDGRRLYWAETDSPAICSADLDGNDKTVIIKDNVFSPVGLTLYKNYLYWSDDKTAEISRALKFDGSDYTKMFNLSENVTDLVIYHTVKQKQTNQCAISNGGCSHLCLALPADNPDEHVKYTCACPTHYLLQGTECVPPQQFMLYSLKNLVVRLVPDTSDCPEAVLPIHGLKAVRAIDYDIRNNVLYWIDGKLQVIKRSDVGSQFSVFVPNSPDIKPFDIAVDTIGRVLLWTCAIKNVINVTRLDNSNPFGSLESREGEQPRLIVIHVSKRLLFYTDVGITPQLVRTRLDGSHRIVITKASDITAIAVDTENDSIVWSQGQSIYISNIDGENKHVLVNESNSKITQLTVHSGWLYWIDRELNQLQRLELTTGKSRSTLPVQVSHVIDLISVNKPKNHTCDQKRCSHFCVLNGTESQCACPNGKMLQEDKRSCQTIPNCGTERFSCTVASSETKDCIPIAWRCDRQKDCSDGSDEFDCPSCEPNQFRCQDGLCIDKSLVCNKVPNCADKSDEKNCCDNGFQCPQTEVCLSLSLVCDGNENCSDGSDEKDCNGIADRATDISLSTIFFVVAGVAFSFILFLTVFFCQRRKCIAREDTIDPPEDSLSPLHSCGQNKHLKMRKGIPDVIRISMLNDSCPSTYDRRHITGASSSSNTNGSSSGCYPRETLNPPPSPVTTAASTRGSSPATRYKPYRHYRAINQPPPPTPCSTDVCDESDYNYPMGRSRYEGPFPPPPTPRSHCHQESCPPSPSSRSSTYFSPLPPPPSPVASPRGDSDS